jgi:hypothetical protein
LEPSAFCHNEDVADQELIVAAITQ